MNIRLVSVILGALLGILSLSMCLPAIVDGVVGNPHWIVFAKSAVVTGFFAGLLIVGNHGAPKQLKIRESFVLTALAWMVLAAFASLPFIFGELKMGLADAYFEAMSGLSTTGSTVIVGLDHMPPGILLWRAILQWLGGLGIIVMAISVLPLMGIGGMQLFKAEAFDTSGNFLPRAADLSITITVVYVGITAACALALYEVGMTTLEAVVHAMTTVATGGFSTSDGSVGHFANPWVDWIITLGMVAGGTPFLLWAKALSGRPGALVADEQVRWYFALIFISTMIISAWLIWHNGVGPIDSLRLAAFNVVSIMTGTGYASADYTLWGALPVGFLFFLTFVGGCAGSTACGMKVFRFQILFATSRAIMRRLLFPHGVFVPRYNGVAITDEVMESVLGFFFLFAVVYVILSTALIAIGLDFVTALSSAATCMSNVGPGLGPIVGPSGTFHDLSDAAKWLLSGGMLIGRLEVFSVVVLFMPTFWKT